MFFSLNICRPSLEWYIVNFWHEISFSAEEDFDDFTLTLKQAWLIGPSLPARLPGPVPNRSSLPQTNDHSTANNDHAIRLQVKARNYFAQENKENKSNKQTKTRKNYGQVYGLVGQVNWSTVYNNLLSFIFSVRENIIFLFCFLKTWIAGPSVPTRLLEPIQSGSQVPAANHDSPANHNPVCVQVKLLQDI